MSREISDSDILKGIKENPDMGFRLLVDKYKSRLYWHIRRIVIVHDDADDALQNTFINCWKSIDNFRSESSLYTWLYSIATNEALAAVRKRSKHQGVNFDDIGDYFSSAAEGDTWFDGDAAQQKLQDAMLKLPEKQRLVFNMKYFDDITYEQMSSILDTSVGALKASYHHAVKKIEKYLSPD